MVVVILIGINAFFVTAEFAIVAARRSRIRQLSEAGQSSAKQVQYFHRHLDRLLSTTQIGITFACLALGLLGESTFSMVFTPLFIALETPHGESLAHLLALPTAFLAIAYLQIVLGELVPKSVAFIYAEELACRLAPIMRLIARITAPFSASVNHSTRVLLKFAGINISRASWSHHVTPEELKFIIASEGDTLGLDAFERAVFKNLLVFGELTAGDVMIPRAHMAVLDHTATYGELLEQIRQTGHNQFPVKADSLDDIQGIIDFRDLALPLQQGQIKDHMPLKPWLRSPRFLPESIPLPELLKKMQRTQTTMLMVVDEFGGTAGVVCWQDVVKQFLDPTEIEEEHERVRVQHHASNHGYGFDVDAQISLTELNNILVTPLPTQEDYHTLSGFLLDQWQRIPKPGDNFVYGEYCFTIISARGPKLESVHIQYRFSDKKQASEAIAVA